MKLLGIDAREYARQMRENKKTDGNRVVLVSEELWEQIACMIEEAANLEECGLLMKLPRAVGDTVYVIAECENISPQLDTTLYSEDGSLGTTTGYYCSYEDNCPHDCEEFTDCEDYKHKRTIFEDIVSLIEIDENGIRIFTEKCGVGDCLNEYCIFSTRQQAEQELNKIMDGDAIEL